MIRVHQQKVTGKGRFDVWTKLNHKITRTSAHKVRKRTFLLQSV